MKYEVTVERLESITFEVEADSAQDATERWLFDGEEVRGKLLASEVTAVELQSG